MEWPGVEGDTSNNSARGKMRREQLHVTSERDTLSGREETRRRSLAFGKNKQKRATQRAFVAQDTGKRKPDEAYRK